MEEVGEDGGEVGEGGEDDEAADEGGEGDFGAHVDAAEKGAENGAEQDSVGGVAVTGGDLAEEMREWSGVVAGEGPEGTGGGEVEADAGDEEGEEGED